jgi:hypothetical protein
LLPDSAPSSGEMWRRRLALMRYARDGAVLDTIGVEDGPTLRVGRRGSTFFYGASGATAVGGDAYYYGPGDAFEIREVGTDRRVRRIIRLDLPRRPVTAVDRKAVQDWLTGATRGTPEEAMFARIAADAEFAAEFPAHGAIQVDDEGNIWVHDHHIDGMSVEREVRVFDRTGRYRGVVRIPPSLIVQHIAYGRVAALRRDGLSPEVVQVFRIERP